MSPVCYHALTGITVYLAGRMSSSFASLLLAVLELISEAQESNKARLTADVHMKGLEAYQGSLERFGLHRA
ncbi:hypothetical protein CPB84DRAFT_1766281 [Gymnopilus junonius]|uniref:Uncharacterized protein n=1 Tax=Gymnopilus junonius TaxID=109634 RepID=A0A9P5TT34_GYMJU|nr:hypothetical protein CPB84DRAFT_1766281 [Gymnopilus junonius]